MIMASQARVWALVHWGRLPGARVERRPVAPYNTKALTHRRIDAAETCSSEAICAYPYPSATARRAMRRFAVRQSPLCPAWRSILASSFRVGGIA